MRYVYDISKPAAYVDGAELKPVAGIRPVRPVAARSKLAVVARQQGEGEPIRQSLPALPREAHNDAGRRDSSAQERRRFVRRRDHRPMLLELRTGIDQRHHNLREDDIVEHIDVKV